ncbi:Protein lin-28 -like protein [Halotydeus destructor]|nr:Protein lin-28 -like protein [Halotydeus destructor]
MVMNGDTNGLTTGSLVSETNGKRRGKCKWFNVAKGWGFITPLDGGPDVFVHQSVIQMGGFRSLGDDEVVDFECKPSEKGFEAISVSGVEGLECKGSHRRPMSKKKFKKVRCYNCGDFANHIASKCNQGPQPKKCHNCKSADHLIADCPNRTEKRPKGTNLNGCGDSTGQGSDLGSEDERMLHTVETGSSLSDKNMSDSGIARSSCCGKTPTTDDTKSETSE